MAGRMAAEEAGEDVGSVTPQRIALEIVHEGVSESGLADHELWMRQLLTYVLRQSSMGLAR